MNTEQGVKSHNTEHGVDEQKRGHLRPVRNIRVFAPVGRTGVEENLFQPAHHGNEGAPQPFLKVLFVHFPREKLKKARCGRRIGQQPAECVGQEVAQRFHELIRRIGMRCKGLIQGMRDGSDDFGQPSFHGGQGRIVQTALASEMERDQGHVGVGRGGQRADAHPVIAPFGEKPHGLGQQAGAGGLSPGGPLIAGGVFLFAVFVHADRLRGRPAGVGRGGRIGAGNMFCQTID